MWGRPYCGLWSGWLMRCGCRLSIYAFLCVGRGPCWRQGKQNCRLRAAGVGPWNECGCLIRVAIVRQTGAFLRQNPEPNVECWVCDLDGPGFPSPHVLDHVHCNAA